MEIVEIGLDADNEPTELPVIAGLPAASETPGIDALAAGAEDLRYRGRSENFPPGPVEV